MARRKHARLVLDCSVAIAWFFQDEADDYADAIQSALEDGTAHVPSLWALEVANVLAVAERRGRTTTGDSDRFLSLLIQLPISVEASTVAQAWNGALQLARVHSISAYDASYLELAQRLDVGLATIDKKLRSVAEAVGVGLFEP